MREVAAAVLELLARSARARCVAADLGGGSLRAQHVVPRIERYRWGMLAHKGVRSGAMRFMHG